LPERRFASAKAFITALRDAVGVPKAAPGPPAAAAMALALFVEVRVADSADSDSDEVLDDVSAVLDLAEQRLRENGWQLPLQTGNALLGANLLPTGDAAMDACRRAGLQLATVLAQELAGRPDAHADVHVNVTLHVDSAELRDSDDVAGGKEISGGGVTSIGAWAPQVNVAGLHLTSAFAVD
jgi:hypothetical protein